MELSILFLYRTIIGRVGLRLLSPSRMKNLLNGGGMQRSYENIHFEGNLCYHNFHKMIWLLKEKPFRV
jgi:hypothetical protein